MFDHSLPVPNDALSEWLLSIPPRPAVFALFGHDEKAEPYISKSANLRRRVHRLLAPAPAETKRLNLNGRIARLEYSEVGSPFTTSLLLLQATRKYCDTRAQKRLHLRPPIVLRLASENPYPRVYVTNRITQRSLASTYGPFPSRATAERFLDDSLNFFELRRCTPELNPDPAFPGCVYSEMKMCLAPCFRGCTDERYAQETERVRQYLASRGQITIAQMEKEREEASEALDFEKAANIHQRIEKMKAVAQQALPLVRPITELDAVIVQPTVQQSSATSTEHSRGPEKLSNRPLRSEGEHVAIFLVRSGRIIGPALYSVEDMRHPNERAGSTSLFAHPTLLEPTPLEALAISAEPGSKKVPRGVLEQRLQAILESLEKQMHEERFSMEQLSEHLSLLARWYYRPPIRRIGEIFFRDDNVSHTERVFPLPRILRGVSRVFCGQKDPANVEAVAGEMNLHSTQSKTTL